MEGDSLSHLFLLCQPPAGARLHAPCSFPGPQLLQGTFICSGKRADPSRWEREGDPPEQGLEGGGFSHT